MKSPVVFGMVVIFIYVVILCCYGFLFVHYKLASDRATTKQIACPLAKFCPAGTAPTGYHAGTPIVFPDNFSQYEGGESITFPYYDDYMNPTEETFTITIDTTTSGGGAVGFMGIPDVGYTKIDPETYTMYINGLSTHSDLPGIVSALAHTIMTSTGSKLSKKAFVSVDNPSIRGTPSLQYNLKVNTATTSYSTLSVSCGTGGTLLSGTENLTLSLAPQVNPPHLVNVYNDYNRLMVQNIAPALSGPTSEGDNKYVSCVEPSFQAAACGNNVYNNTADFVGWINPSENPDNLTSLKYITDHWDDFDPEQLDGSVKFCSPNLDQKNVVNKGGNSGNTAAGYQTNRIAPEVTNTFLKDGVAPVYTSGRDGDKVVGEDYYHNSLVFCGGAAKDAQNYTGGVDTTSIYNSKWPNPDVAAGGFKTLGFS